MKIATWNVNSLKVRLPHVLDWVAQESPDILALQETKLTDENFPKAAIEAAGYQVCYTGQKTYNGVAILSKLAASEIVTDLPGFDDPQRRLLAASFGALRVVDIYVPNGEAVGSEKYHYKLDWLEKLTAYLNLQVQQHPQLVVLGDFNIAPADADVHDPAEWTDSVLCSGPERAAFQGLLDAGFCDTFRRFEQPEKSFSWWDYRMNAFKRNRGLRIDHVLASPLLCESCVACGIDIGPRKLERPSDHTPVVAEFRWGAA